MTNVQFTQALTLPLFIVVTVGSAVELEEELFTCITLQSKARRKHPLIFSLAAQTFLTSGLFNKCATLCSYFPLLPSMPWEAVKQCVSETVTLR